MNPTLNALCADDHGRADIRSLFDRWIEQVDHGISPLRMPSPSDGQIDVRDMYRRCHPAILWQLQGRTEFSFPREVLSIAAGETCVIPAGVLHQEAVRADRDQPLHRVVVGFHGHQLSVHLVDETVPQRRGIESITFFPAPNCAALVTLMQGLLATHTMDASARDSVARGLLLALLGLLRNTVEPTPAQTVTTAEPPSEARSAPADEAQPRVRSTPRLWKSTEKLPARFRNLPYFQ